MRGARRPIYDGVAQRQQATHRHLAPQARHTLHDKRLTDGATRDSARMLVSPVIDSHIHCSEPHSYARPYDPEFVQLHPHVLHTEKLGVEDILDAADAAEIPHLILVTYAWMGDDNRYPLECAERYPDRILGVVG